ncbi:MAG: lipopolysaccharide biosynthesis protein [Anaerostipes sp.]|uniref:lipopolysaccharide biosynthesis protein n=1 Tax=Anaerostipes sp. TaxID=1872530 RepID=UPI00399C2AD2
MKIERTQNAKINIIFGTIYKVYQIVIPFIMRTLMIYEMGMEYAGLNNLFTSIFQILNLAELGIGAALTYSMYKPIAEDNTEEICALLKLYKKCFFVIGCVVASLGILCVPFLGILVSGNIPGNLNMLILYLMYLINTVLSYWLFSYKKSLLYAHQRNDVISKVMLFTSTIQFVLQAYVLVFMKNYYLYLACSIFAQILQNIICAILTQIIYPKYKPEGSLDIKTIADIKKKVQGLITNKIGGTVLRSADSVVISSFLGLSILAVYQNYYFILTAIISIFSIVFESCVAGVGNSLIVETSKKNYEDLKTVTYIVGALICVSCACFVALYQPFMIIWVGKEYLMEFSLVVCLIIYFFLYEIDQLVGLYKDAAGIWYSDRYRTVISAIANLVLNIVLVQYIGLYGVLLSTILALLIIDLPWLLRNVFKTIFLGQSLIGYIAELLKIALYAFISSIITYVICKNIIYGGILGLIIKLIIAVIISVGVFCIAEFRSAQFNKCKRILLSMFRKGKNNA